MENKGKSLSNSRLICADKGAGLQRDPRPHGSFPRSASFSGRFPPLQKEPLANISDPKSKKAIPMRRPKTQPELLNSDKTDFERTSWLNLEMHPVLSRKVPLAESANCKSNVKLLVNVTVARSIGPLRVLVATDATVVDVIKATLASYAKEWRRPILSSDPLSFGLHYSQFTIDCLNPNDKMEDLGSRNFFMCAQTGSMNQI